MASTGKRSGTLCALYSDGTKVTHLTVNSFTINGSTIDVSSKDDSGWKTTLDGQMNFSFSCSARFAEDATKGYASLFASKLARTSVAITIKTLVSGDKVYGGTCRITSLSLTDENEGNSDFTAEFEGTGAAWTT